ncbi:MAG: hypothetical protein Q8R15_00950, partial [Candidatus Micrarchaeota archaeon]|nr:hypothetical protein [Candidatus Micrarchaeota archaeon]
TGKQDVTACSTHLDKAADELGKLDGFVNAVCGPMLTVASATLVIGSIAADAPARGYLAVNDEGNTNFGGTLGISGPDVDCVDNTDTSHENLDVWMDLDFSSLRVKEGVKVACMDKQQIATYAPNEGEAPSPSAKGVDPDNKELTFYITSRNQ